jgi:hypothetical protein
MADRQQLLRVKMTGSDSTGLAEFQDGHVDGGPLVPAYTEAERDLITSATEGMVIYNTDDDRLEVRTSSAWLQLDIGDVTGVTTGATSGISGGATSGAVDIAIDATRLADGTSVDIDEDNDLVILYDNSDTTMKKVNPVQLFTNEALVWMGL